VHLNTSLILSLFISPVGVPLLRRRQKLRLRVQHFQQQQVEEEEEEELKPKPKLKPRLKPKPKPKPKKPSEDNQNQLAFALPCFVFFLVPLWQVYRLWYAKHLIPDGDDLLGVTIPKCTLVFPPAATSYLK